MFSSWRTSSESSDDFVLHILFQRREVIRHLVLRNLAKKSYYSEDGTESIDSDEENENEVTAQFEETALDKSSTTSNDVVTCF